MVFNLEGQVIMTANHPPPPTQPPNPIEKGKGGTKPTSGINIKHAIRNLIIRAKSTFE